MAEHFTPDEMSELADRALELAHEQESDAGLRTALQLLSEAAANVGRKIGGEPENV